MSSSPVVGVSELMTSEAGRRSISCGLDVRKVRRVSVSMSDFWRDADSAYPNYCGRDRRAAGLALLPTVYTETQRRDILGVSYDIIPASGLSQG